ncbi:MAG: hypothetical protein EAX96_04815 [Candidatus Lokiarchaeota archaeon]|nr:hypothetical protein [Candidatus Lokiarchaeota archaeon]
MVLLFGLVINDYFAFVLLVIIVIVLAVITIKGPDFLINLLLLGIYDILDLALADMFVVYFAASFPGFNVFAIVFAIIGIAVQSLWGLKVIYFDGMKCGWKTLKPDQFKDK